MGKKIGFFNKNNGSFSLGKKEIRCNLKQDIINFLDGIGILTMLIDGQEYGSVSSKHMKFLVGIGRGHVHMQKQFYN